MPNGGKLKFLNSSHLSYHTSSRIQFNWTSKLTNKFENLKSAKSKDSINLLKIKKISSFIQIKMKLLQTVQKDFEYYGISSTHHKFNKRNWLTLSIFTLGTALHCAYLFCEAKTFQEYNQSIYMICTLVCAVVIFVVDILTMRIFYGCVDDAEQIVNHSEWN